MKRFASGRRHIGILGLGLMMAVGVVAPQAVGAAKPPVITPNMPGNIPDATVCAVKNACPSLPAITNFVITPATFGVTIDFDMDLKGDPMWGKARIDILQNGNVIKSDTKQGAPSQIRHFSFQFGDMDSLTTFHFKLYELVGADSYVPHLARIGTFQTLMCNFP